MFFELMVGTTPNYLNLALVTRFEFPPSPSGTHTRNVVIHTVNEPPFTVTLASDKARVLQKRIGVTPRE